MVAFALAHPSAILGALLFISEVMSKLTKGKAHGIAHAVYLALKKVKL